MTRVALVAYDDSPPLGGQGVMVEGMRAALERRGVSVDTISGRGDHAIAYPSVLHRAPLDLSLFLNTHPRTLVRSGPDVVHAHGGPGGVSILRRAPVPLVYTAHHTYRQAHKRGTVQRLPAPLEARSYRLARLVLPVSPSTADAVRAMGIAAERIEVVPPGVAIPDAGEGLREPARVLFVGRLEPLKGVLEAVEVMRRLIEARPQVTGAIVGRGSLANQVRAHIAKLPAIEYLGDLDRTAVQREYARAALLLMPSRYEGLGLVALEAQASTTPVVGYDVDGLRDSVVDGGVLVAPGDVAAMHRAAIALLDDPQRRAELGERGREFVRARHSWERITARLEEIYTALAAA